MPDVSKGHLRLLILVLASTVWTTCSSCSGSRGEDAPSSATRTLSVAEAAQRPQGTTMVVRGFVIADGDDVVVTDTLAESYPPQAGGDRMQVRGLQISRFEGVRSTGSVMWTEQPVTIPGTLRDGELIAQ